MNIKSVLVAIACFSLFSFAALPEIRITTQNSTNPDNNTASSGGGGWGMMPGFGATTYKYVQISNFQLSDSENPKNNITRSGKPDSVKVRGNSTAGAEKKPYRIKFGEPISVFGDTAAKSWVLLANWYDGTFALNAMAFEMGRRMDLEFTNRYWFVDVFINNQYKGLYQLTEQIQSHKGRVDLKEKHNGWLVEFDYHDAETGDQKFTTSQYSLGTFIKAPELDDTIPNRPASYLNFVKNDVNALVNKMAAGGYPTNGYRDMIDMESWAKYVLIQLVLDNGDFNSKFQANYVPGSNYAYKIEDCDKIKAGPLWDFDLAAGVKSTTGGGAIGGFPGMGGGTGGFPAHYQTYQDPIFPNQAFYKRLWEDPAIKAKYKKLWVKHKSDFQAMSGFIDQIKTKIEGSIEGKGTQKWANNQMSGGANLTRSAFNTEIQNLKNWWTQRLSWVDGQLNSIDANQDVAESPSTCKSGGGSSSSKASSSSAAASNPGTSSSSSRPSSSSVAVSNPSSSSISSSSGITVSTPNCSDYQASWCGNTAPAINTTVKPTAGQCVFVKDYTSLQVSSGGGTILINGEACTGAYMNCATNKPATKHGGYYIFVQSGGITSSQNYTVTAGAPVCSGTTPILPPAPAISIQNSPAKMEVYNLQGKLVYSGYPENPKILKILVQTKGIYIVKTTLGSEKKIQRMVVK